MSRRSGIPRWRPSGPSKYFDAEAWAVIEAQAKSKPNPMHDRRVVAKMVAVKKANLKARQKAAAEAWHFERSKPTKAWQAERHKLGFSRWHILAGMDLGTWYAASDIAAAARGVPLKTVVGKINLNLLPEGLLEKASNPDHRRGELNGDNPQFLYKLTEAGLAARAVARSELESRGWPKYTPDKKPPPKPAWDD